MDLGGRTDTVTKKEIKHFAGQARHDAAPYEGNQWATNIENHCNQILNSSSPCLP